MGAQIAVLILTKNEAKNIADCIKSIQFADEIIVIDDFSTDETDGDKPGALAQKSSSMRWTVTGAGSRPSPSNKRVNEWIYFIDADERVSRRLADKIKQLVEQD
ncbi:MAG: glycosyltransferase, partial [Selenomonas sp.]|nr:glycosyltransferase [Selenomonas sp.]